MEYWPVRSLHALEIDLGSLAHYPNGDGVPRKNLRVNIKNLA